MTIDHIQNIRQKIEKNLNVTFLEILDESHLHAGHAGARPGGNSHYRLTVVAEEFESIRKIQRHQAIYRILKNELDSHIHALAITALSPTEQQKNSITPNDTPA